MMRRRGNFRARLDRLERQHPEGGGIDWTPRDYEDLLRDPFWRSVFEDPDSPSAPDLIEEAIARLGRPEALEEGPMSGEVQSPPEGV